MVVDSDGLTAIDLQMIANAVEKLGQVGVRVDSAVIGSHRVGLEYHIGDQREGSYYTVTSIRRHDGAVPRG